MVTPYCYFYCLLMDARVNDMVKIRIMLPESDWHTFKMETVWAMPLEEEHLYRLENTPFFADNISYHDIVFAVYDEERDFFVYKSVRKRSGNSTCRIILADGISNDVFLDCMAPVLETGCTYEGFKDNRYALNIPQHAGRQEVLNILKNGQKQGTWYFEVIHMFSADEEL